MPTLYPLAHRVIGKVNAAAPGEDPFHLLVSRVLFMDEIQSREGPWIVVDIVAYDAAERSDENMEAIRSLGSHFSDWKNVCERYNAEDFDASEYEAPECVCGECEGDEQ